LISLIDTTNAVDNSRRHAGRVRHRRHRVWAPPSPRPTCPPTRPSRRPATPGSASAA